MRILRDKRLAGPIQLPLDEAQTSSDCRKRALCAQVQAALKVGSDLAAREAGRRAFAELMKLDRDLQPISTLPGTLPIVPQGQVLLAASPKRRRMRDAI